MDGLSVERKKEEEKGGEEETRRRERIGRRGWRERHQWSETRAVFYSMRFFWKNWSSSFERGEIMTHLLAKKRRNNVCVASSPPLLPHKASLETASHSHSTENGAWGRKRKKRRKMNKLWQRRFLWNELKTDPQPIPSSLPLHHLLCFVPRTT